MRGRHGRGSTWGMKEEEWVTATERRVVMVLQQLHQQGAEWVRQRMITRATQNLTAGARARALNGLRSRDLVEREVRRARLGPAFFEYRLTATGLNA
jgi:DNA-binding HxlR family transcriptional regulator